MLPLSLLALLAFACGSCGLAALAYALARRQGDGGPLPAPVPRHRSLGSPRPLTESLVRVLPRGSVALHGRSPHPLLLGGWDERPRCAGAVPAAVPAWKALLSGLLSTVSLDRLPAQNGGWRSVGWDALRGRCS